MNAKKTEQLGLVPEEELRQRPQFATTLANGLELLRCFSAAEPSLGNKELSDYLGISRPTIARLTYTLCNLGYLVQNPETKKYSLGPAVLTLSYPLLTQLTLRQLAAHDMVELSRFAKGPVSIGMRERLQVVYVEMVHDKDYNDARPDIGVTRPLLNTAIGRALLYRHPENERQILFERLQAEYPDAWQQHKAGFFSAMEQVREKGFCTSYGNWRVGFYGVSVPLCYKFGTNYLAINLTIPAYDNEKDYVERVLGPKLLRLVQDLDSRLGV